MEASLPPDAPAPAPEDPFAALREEIRRAGRVSLRMRSAAGWVVYLGFVLPVTVGLAFAAGQGVPSLADWCVGALVGHVFFWLWGTYVVSIFSPLILLLWSGQLARLRRQLGELPDSARRELLLSLRDDPGEDTRALVEPLLGDLGLPTELTPAGSPEGGGAEVSGVPAPGPG